VEKNQLNKAATGSLVVVMKTHNALFRWVLAGIALASVSCTTTYDYAGRPVQSVDPGVAVAGAAAAGVLGYAAGRDSNRRHHHYHGGYYRRGYYRY
jgi:hypothetical protein